MKYLLFILLLMLFSCRKEQPEMAPLNENCDCATEVSAEFLMEEMTTWNVNFAHYTNTDTIFADKNVRFSALTDNATYTWYIGTEVLHDQQVGRYFDNSLAGQDLPIALVVKKKPNSVCFPSDDGYDSIVKILHVSEFTNESFDTTFMEGTYRVKSPLLSDSIDIVIDFRYYSGSGKNVDVYNYDGQGSFCTGLIELYECNYRQFYMGNTSSVTQCDYLRGSAVHKLNDSVELNFSTGGYVNGTYDVDLYQWKYKGRKL